MVGASGSAKAAAAAVVLALVAAGCRFSAGDDGAPVAAVDGRSSSAAAVSADTFDPYAGTRPAAAAAGQVFSGTILTSDARTRSYRLYVPASLGDDPDVPLLVALHGGGGSGEQFQRSSGFDGLAEANRFLVVYPDGWGTGPDHGALRTWNAGSCCVATPGQAVDDVAFIRQILDAVAAIRFFDPKRVFAIGHANGGMLAYRLACEVSDVFAAVGVQAGALMIGTCPVTQPVSLLHLHGTTDGNVPLAGGTGVGRAAHVTFPPAHQSAAALAAAGGCGTEAQSVTDRANEDLTISTWPDCPGGADVQLITVDGASHAWMGHDRGPAVEGLVGEAYPDLDASRALWAFVAAHPRT